MIKKRNKFFSICKKLFDKKIHPILKSVKFLPKTLGRIEKISLIFLGAVIILAGVFIWQRHWIATTHPVSSFGGTFTEGIVGEPKDLEKHISRLTGAGLTRIDASGNISGDLAESWQVLDDGKTYQFKIRPGYSANDLLSQIQAKNAFSTIESSAPDDATLVFKFKQSFSPFLYIATEPIFANGPYKITHEEQGQVTLDADPSYWQGTPFISKIQINLYPNFNALSTAAKSGDISGYLKNSNDNYQMPNATTFSYPLPRELDLFFNLSKDSLKDVGLRRNLRDGKEIGKQINLVIATADDAKDVQIANSLKQKWQPLGVNLEVKTYSNVDLQKTVIPNRDYDLLLYGEDYGPDPDPYPFWHSSQIGTTGSNLSNYANKKADKLLEDARLSFDAPTRDQKYKDFDQILTDDVPYISVEKASTYYVVSNDVKGISKLYGSSEADRFLNINQWYIKTKRVKN